MLSKTEQLQELFLEWETAQENEPDDSWMRTRAGKNITKSHFRRDGIIDEEAFAREEKKVLFISNEANDDEYSAKFNPKPNNVDDYRKYYETGYDDWRGKMRERTSALYKVIAGIGINEIADSYVAIRYAVMDLNKRGGGADVNGALHIREYCKYYQDFIRKEIEIIDPDIVVWLGVSTYDMELHVDYLGAEKTGEKVYFRIGNKKVPVLRMWQTSFYQGKIEPLPGYSNRITGKLCAKCKEELERYGLKEKNEECFVCKAPLEYLKSDILMECAICHKKENSKTRCVNGHYVCDECHTQGLDAIIGSCMEETSKNPIEIIEK